MCNLLAIKKSLCLNFIVLAVKMAEIFEKKHEENIFLYTKKDPRIRKKENLKNRATHDPTWPKLRLGP